MGTFTATSGAQVVINCAGFSDALTLKHAIEREAALALRNGTFFAVLMVDSSESVNAALWPCLARCTYRGEKITMDTFKPREARADYYDIVRKCIEENLGPLAEGLRSQLSEFGLVKKTEVTRKDQESESMTSEL